jgi:hypothetical protein
MLPLERRAKVAALAVFFNRMGSGSIALTFLSLNEALGAAHSFLVRRRRALGLRTAGRLSTAGHFYSES